MERIVTLVAVAPGPKLEKRAVLPLIQAALKEDVGAKDLTSDALIGREQTAKADLVVREEGIIAGLPLAEWTFGAADPKVRFKPTVRDGQKVYPGKAVAFVEGPARGILAAERVALNFVGRLSGIATLTRAFVERTRGTGARILDTRKTTPTLRLLERYAVAAGGGVNHRAGLYSQVLIKENHLRLAGGVEKAVARVRARIQKGVVVEVEVTGLQELRQALAARPDIILLDNMRLAEIQEAVRLRNAVARSSRKGAGPLWGSKVPGRPGTYRPLLEVSGGVTLQTVRAIALAGVERISVGALTHSAPALDVALEVVR
ncbi:MAG: carboxylating nicotinate-nucleotide diphosphorylase [Candidatus Omnitrophica bacterium]|nr:carboxylating nicotinate-nucleotide diphosphorylase [Candidatus Omnitrophota bacterium]